MITYNKKSKIKLCLEVVKSQVVKLSLPTPEVYSSKSAIGKIYSQLYWKGKNKEKRGQKLWLCVNSGPCFRAMMAVKFK